jgi:hypothetical protein
LAISLARNREGEQKRVNVVIMIQKQNDKAKTLDGLLSVRAG